MMRIDGVDPREFAEQASLILREAWEPPGLLYASDYLRWQFDFPGGQAPLGVAAFDGDEPVGYFGAVPRRLRLDGAREDVHLLSFLAVRPAWRGPLAFALYRALFEALNGSPRPIVTFVGTGTMAEAIMLRNFAAAGYRKTDLGEYQTYGYLDRPGAGALDVQADEANDDDYLALVALCRDQGTLWSDPDTRQLGHYREDPRGRALVVARDADGRSIGAAMVVRAAVLEPGGPSRLAMLDSVHMPEPSPVALQAILRFAARRWAGPETSPFVSAPNLRGIGPEVLKAAGLRAMPSRFTGYLFSGPEAGPPRRAVGTNLEIV